jgi:hypothetical protein
LISEIKFIQAAPPTSITGESALKLCKVLIITITKPKSPRQSTQWLPSTTFPRADLWEERERSRAEILTAVDVAEASIERCEGRTITHPCGNWPTRLNSVAGAA